MAKHKIPKNRSLEDMFKGVKEEASQQTAEDFRKQFFTDDLQKKVGTILLDIKMAYYKDGVGDISLEVVKDGRNVVIKTAPKMSKRK